MNKGIGFNRTVQLPWLDATAALCAESMDSTELRVRLQSVVGQHIQSPQNLRRTIDILLNIWLKTENIAADLRQAALTHFRTSPHLDDRLWLHYGLALLAYPFFRESAAIIGQLSRSEEAIRPAMVKHRLIAQRGQLGSLEKAVGCVVSSLLNWGILTVSSRRYAYTPQRHGLAMPSLELETWLLACALEAHPAEELAFGDLVRLPELFPFRFSLGVDTLRQHPRFSVYRQGSGWDIIGLQRSRD